MSKRIIVKIETFEFETKYAYQDYVKCGLATMPFRKNGRTLSFAVTTSKTFVKRPVGIG